MKNGGSFHGYVSLPEGSEWRMAYFLKKGMQTFGRMTWSRVLLRSDYEMIRRSYPVTVISAYFSYGQWPIDDKLYTLSIPIQHGVFHSSIAV